MTREEIMGLKIGDSLENTIDIEAFTNFTKLKENARWGVARKVVEINYRGINVDGKAYVGGYTAFGENSSISFSICEGEMNYRLGA